MWNYQGYEILITNCSLNWYLQEDSIPVNVFLFTPTKKALFRDILACYPFIKFFSIVNIQ